MAKSPQRRTADALVEAFNRMDIDFIISLRHPDCLRAILPASMNVKPQDNDTYRQTLEQLKPIFRGFSLVENDAMEDREAKRIALWLTAKADTAAGEYVNEYVWTIDFDEGGKQIVKWSEFVDSVMYYDFFPKLKEAMRVHHQEANGNVE